MRQNLAPIDVLAAWLEDPRSAMQCLGRSCSFERVQAMALIREAETEATSLHGVWKALERKEAQLNYTNDHYTPPTPLRIRSSIPH